MAMSTLSDLLENMVRDIYYAEKKAISAMAKMAKESSSEELKAALEEHRAETEEQVTRLDQVFEMLGKSARGKKCAAVEGLIEEAQEVMDEAEDDATRDAGIIAAAQAVEHYEIARYGTMVAFAKQLELDDVAELLQTTLDEEKAADEKLSALAESQVNEEAAA
jgi:ferritin-like metal-binding protein YciE